MISLSENLFNKNNAEEFVRILKHSTDNSENIVSHIAVPVLQIIRFENEQPSACLDWNETKF